MEQSLQALSKQERLDTWNAETVECQSAAGAKKMVSTRRPTITGSGDYSMHCLHSMNAQAASPRSRL